ncbi:eukaryotic translation initiation factor 3i [Volvox carteri f. nagariensis]|uniref:Eukaryotic translation initiation factor 3 subunit I n=1 Tax=Volvox carteri f. nagariensis TaxID=3068 RepID=D8UF07_VOLCA|nr:eukaryotic translation initiation factor 3i [Volvox carteri f. nagariensis]EFJ41733.1 eukaryotic translation initiation factor 3i [Volvox carteri f. nagariensis]|eukprot:XP_002957235.1 eukaryotic translation initiation factor 3i [Volvox carteri f. nagariensis]
MRPYLLKGHERPLTQVKYNREGDLLVSCAKDHQPCLWSSEDGRRIGTYEGHNGAIWTCDITWESDRLITGSGDQTIRIWDLPTGKELFQIRHGEPCRAVKLSAGERFLAATTDAFIESPPGIHIYNFAENVEDQRSTPVNAWTVPKGRITRIFWTDCNRKVITSHDYGILRRWDVETGQMLQEVQVHEDAIQDMQMSPDETHVITASLDKTARLIDIETFTVLKVYKTGRFVQSAAISPLFDHVLMGGGQDASQVTTTAAGAGGFEARFFHKVFQEEFGRVRGHFGPVNTVAFHPSGRSFTTGGEDGYVRLHHMDLDYFTTKFF